MVGVEFQYTHTQYCKNEKSFKEQRQSIKNKHPYNASMQTCMHRGDYLPSDHSTLQVINLDKFTKAAGVVVVGCLGISKGLTEIRKERNTVGFRISS